MPWCRLVVLQHQPLAVRTYVNMLCTYSVYCWPARLSGAGRLCTTMKLWFCIGQPCPFQS